MVAEAVAVQPWLSVTPRVYVPAVRPETVLPLSPPGFQEYV